MTTRADVVRDELRPVGEQEQETGQEDYGANNTDMGNAKRLATMFGHRLKYVTHWGWMWYDGIRWKAVDDVYVQGLAKQVLTSMQEEALRLKRSKDKQDQEAGTKLGLWAYKSEFNSHIRDMVLLARDEVQAAVEDFDTDPWLFNAQDVTVDLRTGETHEHTPKDMLTKVAGTAYNAPSAGTRFYQFLQEVFGGKQDLINYVQEVFGYTTTDVTREQHFWLAHGSGRNGKTRLYEITAKAMGDYSVSGRASMIVDHGKFTSKDFDLATMVGARRVTFNETKPGEHLNEQLIKDLTGDDTAIAEAKFRAPFRFRPHFKMHLRTNNLPDVQEVGDALWERLRIIPFRECFIAGKPGCHEPDLKLEEKLNEELPEILRWLVQGAVRWYEHGLNEPEGVRLATDSYQDDQDPIKGFIDERTIRIPEADRTNVQELYQNYVDWYEGPYLDRLDVKVFGKLLKDKGFAGKRSNGTTWYYGIAINPDVETTQEHKMRERQERQEEHMQKLMSEEEEETVNLAHVSELLRSITGK